MLWGWSQQSGGIGGGDRNGSGDGPRDFFFKFIKAMPHPHVPRFSPVSTFNKVTNALAL